MARTISIFKTLNSASTSLTYGTNSGGARIFEGYFIEHQLDARNNPMSRYQACGKIVGLAVKGSSTVVADTIQVSVRQGSAAGAVNTLWAMSAGAACGLHGGTSAGGCGIVIRRGKHVDGTAIMGLPTEGVSFDVNTDNQASNHKDLYVFVKANNARVGNCTVRLDIELDDGRGTLKPHKRARFLGTSAGALY